MTVFRPSGFAKAAADESNALSHWMISNGRSTGLASGITFEKSLDHRFFPTRLFYQLHLSNRLFGQMREV